MLKHWIWLSTRKGIGPHGQASLLRKFSSAENIYALTKKQCEATEGFQRRWLEPILDKDTSEAEKLIVECDKLGISILTYAERAYPERLKNTVDPPVVLYYKGTFPKFDDEAVIAVVGTRTASAYGLLHAKQFSKLIAASGGIIVSGGARGIDTMALRGALDSAMPVVCVLGCGLDIAYPSENRQLFKEVEMHGCMISEFPPRTQPIGTNFPRRNRIMSGLALGVLVVEAPKGSGALITANHALEQGRDVYTIPGNIGARQCEGNNALLRDGAGLVMDGWELLENYKHLFPDKISDGRNRNALESIFAYRYGMELPVYSPVRPQEVGDKKSVDIPTKKPYIEKKDPPAGLTEEEKTVLSLLSDELLHIDEITALSKLPAQKVTAALTMLQIKQLAQKRGANYFVRN